eukprot:2590875-Lingulodinium_polyedra.AAC.1
MTRGLPWGYRRPWRPSRSSTGAAHAARRPKARHHAHGANWDGSCPGVCGPWPRPNAEQQGALHH